MNEDISFCGRVFTAGELDLIRQIITDFPRLSRAELAHTICELLGWRRPNGGLKNCECVEFLRKLQHQDCLPKLPQLRKTKTPGPHALRLGAHSDPQPPLRGPLAEFQPLRLQLIADLAGRRLFQQDSTDAGRTSVS